jgi:hypothetical protein
MRGNRSDGCQRKTHDNKGMTNPPADARTSRMTVRRYATAAEADRDDVLFWRQMPDAERVVHAWRLSQELWRLRGELPDEPGLCRSVARVRRR